MKSIAAELRVLDRVEDGPAADTISDAWTIVTGWMWGVTPALLFLLIMVTYLLFISRRA